MNRTGLGGDRTRSRVRAALLVLGATLPLLVAVGAGKAAGPYSLTVSASSSRSNPVALEGTTQSGTIYVFTQQAGTSDISKVQFWLDDPQMTGTPRKSESTAPYDFAGGTVTVASPFDTTTISNGSHTITAKVTHTNATTALVSATFAVQNGSTAPSPPDQVHLAWVGDPATTLTVVWRTKDATVPSTVEYRKKGDTTWSSATGSPRTSGTTGRLHEVNLTGLAPATAYEYRVRGPADTWSDVFATRTAPSAGPADFDFVYFADTGLIGRSDGLATGTQQVRDEIAKLNPLLVLGGGDYAYYNSDTRYGTLEATIDAWFNQTQPIAAQSPLMPTYGNHEVLLGEGFSNWAARFPTPTGFDSRKNYSFNLGDAHFVSILAVSDTAGLTQATLDWISQDLSAAKAAGKRWLIPFMHVPSFGDGTNHPQNKTLRGQLAPIFERNGVKLVITSHDQAYERSYPLTKVTSSAYTITSTSKSCYTMSDGITWVKVSPGGKLSNISSAFSPFKSSSPPSWTAYRDNTSHVFAHVRISASGTLRFDAYGVKGDGSAPFVKDSFGYTTGSCSTTPALTFSPDTLSFSAPQGAGAASKTVDLTTSNGTAAAYSLSEDASWLGVSPSSGGTPGTITVTADPTGLAPGTYTANVAATASGYESDTLPVTLTVTGTGTYKLNLSTSSSRSNPVELAGRTVSGSIYVFTAPDSGVYRVRFFLDDPQMTGAPRRTEASAPYDFAGTNSDTAKTAKPFDTRTLANGSHTIIAAVDLSAGGTEVVSATFTAAN